MRIFVTGLCLQGNKGGPAIALSLKQQITRYIPDARFVFAVPPGEEFRHERKWAPRYAVGVVEDFVWSDVLPRGGPRRMLNKAARLVRWIRTATSCDAVIDMSAMSYIGPPVRPEASVLHRNRLRFFLACRSLLLPFVAWTQSYGPFSTPLIRRLARWDLGRLGHVLCRGEESLGHVRELMPGKSASNFPDVAVVLNYDKQVGKEHIRRVFPDGDTSRLVTLSPSAVLYENAVGAGAGNAHVEQVVELCRHLIAGGYRVLFVPHTFRPGRHDPALCDFGVAQEVIAKFENDPQVGLVTDDLSPMDLKSIISNAHVHVGGRYHSVVAALSSGVPCVSMSWHHKYKDIMRMYGCERYVHEGGIGSQVRRLIELVDELLDERDAVAKRMIAAQVDVASEVDRNTRMVAGWLERLCR